MTDDTHYLPSARLPRSAVREQLKIALRPEVLLKLVNTTSEPLAILNPERQIVYCNEACWRLAGLSSQDEAIGLRPGDLLHCVNVAERPGGCGTTENCQFCDLAQALVKGQEGHATAGRCLIEGSLTASAAGTDYQVRVTPIPEAGPGWVCYSMTDISRESRRRALERTFFHDIMNRAFAVEGVADALVDESISSTDREDLTSMLGVAVRGLVEEIKSQRVLLAAESGELAVDPVQLNSLDVLRDAVRTGAAFWLDEDARLEIELGSQSVDFESDPALLGRILVNLLKNAIESSEPGQTVVTGCHRDREEVCFFVHNEGAMKPAVAARVFQRSYSTKGHSRGLGTYSVRLLTEEYLGGEVSFQSAPAAGTTFQVRLPLIARPRQATDTAETTR
ncbi:PAS domain-containing sensor histidine kinase [Paludibaculum fermentans]|uniref:GHKL domain-containing protein n=1 Tax=Paludibaculum fermentans TaxID=1473598 RepID=A0A7S7NR70_PALFE|nr:ATP-binding protein [Paludibaculum fermentans]QOY88287.1 GHKL domain-containing protein [Paludibaculum fermentans]